MKNNIRNELENLSSALRKPLTQDRYCQLYAAQQALSWANNPEAYASPYLTIVNDKVHSPMDIQEDSASCSAVRHPLPSSDICCHNGLPQQ